MSVVCISHRNDIRRARRAMHIIVRFVRKNNKAVGCKFGMYPQSYRKMKKYMRQCATGFCMVIR